MARRATFIESVRQEKKNVLVVDAGDSLLTLQRVGDLEQGKLLAEAFNRMGYDAMALGGLDLRMGLDVLYEQINVARFPILSANVQDPRTNQFLDRDYVIVEMEGHRIALIGLTDPQIAMEVTRGKVNVTEPVQTLIDLIGKIKGQADIIIVLSHLGTLFDVNMGQVVSDVDLIVGGKDKEIYDPPLKANGIVIVSAGSRGEHVGQIDLEFDAEGGLMSYQGRVKHLLSDVADHSEMKSWMSSSGLIPATAPKSSTGGDLKP